MCLCIAQSRPQICPLSETAEDDRLILIASLGLRSLGHLDDDDDDVSVVVLHENAASSHKAAIKYEQTVQDSDIQTEPQATQRVTVTVIGQFNTNSTCRFQYHAESLTDDDRDDSASV